MFGVCGVLVSAARLIGVEESVGREKVAFHSLTIPESDLPTIIGVFRRVFGPKPSRDNLIHFCYKSPSTYKNTITLNGNPEI